MEVLKYHIKETDNLLANTNENFDAILWPENSIDVDPFNNQDAGDLIKEVLKNYDKPLLSGAVLQESEGLSNSVILWDPKDLNVVDKYAKIYLVPFGEYLPFREFLSKYIKRFSLIPQDFIPGKNPNNIILDKAVISPVICFEILSDRLLQQDIGNSNLIIAQTNNATFGESAESDQQLQITRARAIESGRNIVVVSTVGNTAFIDRTGEIISILPKYEAGVLYGEVNLTNENTSALWFSSWVVKGSVAAIFVLLIFSVRRRFFRVA
jgi:apolipoprotein N-acyltransferase